MSTDKDDLVTDPVIIDNMNGMIKLADNEWKDASSKMSRGVTL